MTAARSPLHIRLDEAGFKRLLRGESVPLEALGGQQVLLILADIGWGRIHAAVDGAYKESRERDG